MSAKDPVRSCVVCRTRAPQGTLLRVVRAPDGAVRVDTGPQRAAGRGAYLCRAARCVHKARPALARALRRPVPDALEDEVRRAVQDDAC